MNKKKVEELMSCASKALSEMKIKREKARNIAEDMAKAFFPNIKL